jgi:translation initiation factor eIF-2B subunit epsilon
LQLLYNAEVVEEDAFFKWADEKTEADAEDRVFLDRAADFMNWLRTAEEEEDSEDGDGDEED